ncbi:hypothetical protein AG1IA_05888 [Rhizoctonia solani AG-1 IA]|uniref:Uncharacterized protein n=1 Tax=Thanatephorus cucumeris (strain AG1-IA) TaxID=983506 RepID=L8WTJ5_THACA|nr:hypothetical protein AG1IA_05888 [Rhizoctonia solani AG-1 IA]
MSTGTFPTHSLDPSFGQGRGDIRHTNQAHVVLSCPILGNEVGGPGEIEDLYPHFFAIPIVLGPAISCTAGGEPGAHEPGGLSLPPSPIPENLRGGTRSYHALSRSFSSGTTSAGSSPNEDDYDPNEPTARGMMNYSNAHGNSQFRDRERGKVEERRKYEERKRHDQENQANQDQGGTN